MRRVLVTGGGSGIGRGIARRFATDGSHVTICGRRANALEETKAEFDMECVVADVTLENDVAALCSSPFDVVVANAGAGEAARITETSLEVWNRTLAVTLTGVFLTFRAALPSMEKGGRLIAVASTASLMGGPRLPAYAAAKHGVLGLVRSVARDVAKDGITCNAICPGFVDTDMAETAMTNVMDQFGADREKALSMIVSGNPMARLITVDEVAETAFFLASQGAASINGHALSVSGGEI